MTGVTHPPHIFPYNMQVKAEQQLQILCGYTCTGPELEPSESRSMGAAVPDLPHQQLQFSNSQGSAHGSSEAVSVIQFCMKAI